LLKTSGTYVDLLSYEIHSSKQEIMSQLNISPCGGTVLKFNLNAEIPNNFKWNKKHRLYIKTLNLINNQRFTLKLNFNTVPEQKKGEILSCDKDP
jgi:hypothetical protein